MSCRKYEGKRGPSYYYTIDVAPRGAPRQQVQRRGFRTQKECKAAREKELTERRVGVWLEPSSETLGDYLERWRDTNAHRWRGSTLSSVTTVCRRVATELGGVALGRLTGLQIQESYQRLLAGDRPLAHSTLMTHHTILKQALNQAVRWNLIRTNPAAGVRVPTRERVPVDAWSAAQRASFLSGAAEDPFLPLWSFLLDSGCRVGEVRALAWRDVELATGNVTIRRTMTRTQANQWVIGEDTKTTSSRRTFRIAPETVALLARQHRRQAAQRLSAGPLWHDLGLVFTRADGTPLRPDQITDALRRGCVRAGVPILTAHGLRKTMTTLWLEAGVSPAVVAARLGHASVQMTLNVYTRVSRAWGEQGLAQVAAYLAQETDDCEQSV